uniref:Centromere protein S n=1 Tax=Varanus komodoensis TaxID=61221 RepID=A0A8D2LBA4_VARKO
NKLPLNHPINYLCLDKFVSPLHRHAKRSTINAEDVKLLARRSNSLQVPATLDRSELLAFLSELAEWASRMNEAPLPRPEKMTPVPREERTPVPQPPTREKVPCKNFFWKTFSSC